MSAPLDRKACHLEFNHPPLQPSDSGEGVETIPDDVLYRESENDDELRKLLIAGSVPTVEIIYKYGALLFVIELFWCHFCAESHGVSAPNYTYSNHNKSS